jgi:hypothetical protein
MRMLTLPQTGAQHAQLLHGQRGVGARVGQGSEGQCRGWGRSLGRFGLGRERGRECRVRLRVVRRLGLSRTAPPGAGANVCRLAALRSASKASHWKASTALEQYEEARHST